MDVFMRLLPTAAMLVAASVSFVYIRKKIGVFAFSCFAGLAVLFALYNFGAGTPAYLPITPATVSASALLGAPGALVCLLIISL